MAYIKCCIVLHTLNWWPEMPRWSARHESMAAIKFVAEKNEICSSSHFPPHAVSLGSAIVPLHLAINHIFFTEYRIFFLCRLSSGSGTGETQLLRWLRGRRGCVASKLFGSGRLLFFFLPFSFIMRHFSHCIITSLTFFVPSPFLGCLFFNSYYFLWLAARTYVQFIFRTKMGFCWLSRKYYRPFCSQIGLRLTEELQEEQRRGL